MASPFDLDAASVDPPKGVESNFNTTDNMRREIIVCETLSITAATLALLMRLYTRQFLIRRIAWEDYTLLLGWALFIAVCGLSIMSTIYGVGRHQWDVSFREFFASLYWINVMSICYCSTIFTIKLSILLQYISIFVPVRKGNMFIYAGSLFLIACNFIYYTALTFIITFLCRPREFIWNKALPEQGTCIDLGIVFFITGIYNTISNAGLLILPIGPIWKLKLNWKSKLAVSIVFATGLLACVGSIARLVYIIRLREQGDLTYNMVFVGYWTIAEPAIGIFCASILVFPRFYQDMSSKIRRTLGITPSSSISDSGLNKTGTTASQEPWLSSQFSRPVENQGDYFWLDDRDPVPASKRRNHSSTRVRASTTDVFHGLSSAGAEGLGITKTVQIDVIRE